MYVLKTGIAWRDIKSKIHWNSIYKVFIKLNNYKTFESAYNVLLNKYLKKTYNNKLKYISTDTTFVPNKNGKDLIGYNKYYNRKNGTKISVITDSKGIPLDVKCYKGNMYDSKILLKHLSNYDLDTLKDKSPKKKYFLADPGYDTHNIRKTLIDKGYVPIIQQNIRNTKDPKKIIKFNKQEKKLYNKRLTIERTFSKIKSLRKIQLRYESYISTFIGFIYLSFISILH